MRTRVWDLPTRLFHWGLALGVVVAFFSGDQARAGALHVTAGWLVAGLLGFRVGWGWLGERWSRWTGLGREPGHDRVATASVGLAVGLLVALIATGAAVLGGEEARGPLAGTLSAGQGVAVHPVHTALAWGLVAWLGVHLAGVARKSWEQRQNLVRGMVDGRKRFDGAPVRVRGGVAAVMLVVGASGAGWGWATADRPASRGPLAQSAAWDEACGECHLAFHPSLLPARSWDAMLASEDHFGEYLGLDPATTEVLRAYADANSAERGATETAVRIGAEGPAPARITETATWRAAHAGIDPEQFAQAGVESELRCGACHPDARDGTFDGRQAGVPQPGAPARLAGREP